MAEDALKYQKPGLVAQSGGGWMFIILCHWPKGVRRHLVTSGSFAAGIIRWFIIRLACRKTSDAHALEKST
jgi:hypothetical protein